MAQLGTTTAPAAAQMSPLQLNQIQSGGIAPIRRSSEPARASSCALHVLLAPVLLGIFARSAGGMSISKFNCDRQPA
jgi:hypothetical protein